MYLGAPVIQLYTNGVSLIPGRRTMPVINSRRKHGSHLIIVIKWYRPVLLTSWFLAWQPDIEQYTCHSKRTKHGNYCARTIRLQTQGVIKMYSSDRVGYFTSF